MIIRRYKLSDHKEVMELHVRALKFAGTYIEDPKLRVIFDQDFKDVAKSYFEDRGEFLVAEDQGAIVGMGAIKKIDDKSAELKKMRVEPALHRKGIGGQVLDQLITAAKKLGYSKLILDVAETSIPAQKLYESRGFKLFKKGMLHGEKSLFYDLDLIQIN